MILLLRQWLYLLMVCRKWYLYSLANETNRKKTGISSAKIHLEKRLVSINERTSAFNWTKRFKAFCLKVSALKNFDHNSTRYCSHNDIDNFLIFLFSQKHNKKLLRTTMSIVMYVNQA